MKKPEEMSNEELTREYLGRRIKFYFCFFSLALVQTICICGLLIILVIAILKIFI